MCGTFRARGYFILHKLQELDAAKFLTVTVNLYYEQEKEPQGITKVEWKVILEHMGASPDEIKDVQVKMGKWRQHSWASAWMLGGTSQPTRPATSSTCAACSSSTAMSRTHHALPSRYLARTHPACPPTRPCRIASM